MPKKKGSNATASQKGNRKTCNMCGQSKLTLHFYCSFNPLHPDGYMPMCKDCIKDACYNEDTDDVDVDKLKNLLRQLDRPFILDYYEAAVKQYENMYSGKRVSKRRRLEIVGYYFKNIQTLKQCRTLTWEEGLKFSPPSYEIVQSEKRSEDDEIVYGMTGEDFEVTRDVVRLFGEGYSKKEYKAMQTKYDFLKQNYPSITNLHIEALVSYVRLKVKAEMATARGSIAEAKSWDELATKAAEKAKINPSQLSQKDLQGGFNSFSETFQAVEQAVDVIPILPQFKYRPNDSADFIIWCFINYLRRLEGKPDCSYDDVYHFYDERKDEYIKQYGDPYGIFTEDPTEKNREKIKQFIDIPSDE